MLLCFPTAIASEGWNIDFDSKILIRIRRIYCIMKTGLCLGPYFLIMLQTPFQNVIKHAKPLLAGKCISATE